MIIKMTIGNNKAYVNSSEVVLDQPPIIENGRTLVPFRFVGESIGAKIEWDSVKKAVSYELGLTKIILTIGSNTAYVNNVATKLDVAPKILSGRTLVPIRFISESVGAKVDWDGSKKLVTITVSEQPVTLKFGGTMATDDLLTQSMYKVADLVKEKSNGTIKIEVYPSSQLGKAVSQMEAVSLGTQDMFMEASVGYMVAKIPDMDITSYFWVIENDQHYKNLINSALWQKWITEYLNQTGVRTLASNYIRLPQLLSSKKPIKTLDDFKGLKVRIPPTGSGPLNCFKALGASPTPVDWSEVYLALSQGVVDACFASTDNMYAMKFYEPTKRVILANLIYNGCSIWINDKKFKSLSPRQQQILIDATNEIGEWYSSSVKSQGEDFLNKMREAGTSIEPLDIAPLKKVIENLIKQFVAQGKIKAGLYEEIQKLKP